MNHSIKQISLLTLIAFLTHGPTPTLKAQSAAVGRKVSPESKALATEPLQDRGLFSATAIAELDPTEPEKAQPHHVYLSATQNEAAAPLIITTSPISEKESSQIQEDMLIMARLLTDTLGPSNSTAWASGIPLVNYVKESKNRNLFIKETGALFFLNVDFPLSGPGAEPKVTEETPKDTAWERARRKVYGNRSGNSWTANNLFQSYQFANQGRPKPYKAEQVQVLKERIAAALGSATNIRSLKPNDRIWVLVTGPGAPRQRADFSSGANGWTQFGFNAPDTAVFPPSAPFSRNANQVHSNPPVLRQNTNTRLTISATKSDIDDFSDGSLSLNEFANRLRSRVQ